MNKIFKKTCDHVVIHFKDKNDEIYYNVDYIQCTQYALYIYTDRNKIHVKNGEYTSFELVQEIEY